MNRHVAFLRGMNVGGHRLTNDELCGHFRALGLVEVSAFLASGNVLFVDARAEEQPAIARRIEQGLHDALGYEVPTFLRTASEIDDIARRRPFDPELMAQGKPQVALLGRSPGKAAGRKVLEMAGERDLLALAGRELHWLPLGSYLDTDLDLGEIESVLGPMTVRTQRTIERLAKKLEAL